MLRRQIVEFVARGDLALASGATPGGGFERLWHNEVLQPEEVAFENDVFLVTKVRAEQLANPRPDPNASATATGGDTTPQPAPAPSPAPPIPTPDASGGVATVRLSGTIPPEAWSRFGTKVLPKLRAGSDLQVDVDLSVGLDAQLAAAAIDDLHQALDDLEISDSMAIERTPNMS